jgi:predicted RND superfamily exporter protein
LISFLLNARYAVFAAVVLLLVALVVAGKRVSYEQSIKSFFADDDPVMAVYQQAARSFGDDNFVFVAYDDPALFTKGGMDRVAELAAALGPDRIDGVLRVESLDAMPLLWAVDDTLLKVVQAPPLMRNFMLGAAKKAVRGLDLRNNAMTVGGAVRSAPNEEALRALKDRATRHPLFNGTVVDGTGNTTAVVVRLRKTGDHDVTRTIAAIREHADKFGRTYRLGRPAVVGPPVLLADGFASIERDGRRLAAVGMFLIFLVTLSAVRSLWWALVPIVTGWLVWLATEEILATFHLKLALSGGPLVAQIIVLTMPAASHLAIHFRDDRRRERDPRVAARTTLRAVWTPVAWCAITGAIGYGALVISDVMPVKQFGAILGTCTLVAAVLVVAISPVAMLPPFPLEVPVRFGSDSWVSGRMNRLTARVVRHPLPIVLGVFALVAPLSLGMGNLRFESNYINAFKPETRVVNDYNWVESRLGGIGVVEVVVPVGGSLDVAALGRFREVERAIGAVRVRGERAVHHVISLATVLDPDGRVAALGAEPAGRMLAAKLDLIALTPQAELLNGFWNKTTGEARVLVRLREQQPAPDKEAIFGQSLAAARRAFGPEAYLTGLSYLMTKTTEAVILTQWQTFAWSAAGILLMLTLALRSPAMAALAILPTLLAVGLVLGLMGWLGIKLDMATALVASVALGLSVDDTFHCLLQFRRERSSRSFTESLFTSYSVTGPGVLLSSLAVAVGFAALRLSEFAPFSNFGTMVGIATAGSTLGNLVLLPACLALGDRLRRRKGHYHELDGRETGCFPKPPVSAGALAPGPGVAARPQKPGVSEDTGFQDAAV